MVFPYSSLASGPDSQTKRQLRFCQAKTSGTRHKNGWVVSWYGRQYWCSKVLEMSKEAVPSQEATSVCWRESILLAALRQSQDGLPGDLAGYAYKEEERGKRQRRRQNRQRPHHCKMQAHKYLTFSEKKRLRRTQDRSQLGQDLDKRSKGVRGEIQELMETCLVKRLVVCLSGKQDEAQDKSPSYKSDQREKIVNNWRHAQ